MKWLVVFTLFIFSLSLPILAHHKDEHEPEGHCQANNRDKYDPVRCDEPATTTTSITSTTDTTSPPPESTTTLVSISVPITVPSIPIIPTPTTTLSEVTLPKITLPTVTLPTVPTTTTITIPKVTLPEITLPTIPGVDLTTTTATTISETTTTTTTTTTITVPTTTPETTISAPVSTTQPPVGTESNLVAWASLVGVAIGLLTIGISASVAQTSGMTKATAAIAPWAESQKELAKTLRKFEERLR